MCGLKPDCMDNAIHDSRCAVHLHYSTVCICSVPGLKYKCVHGVTWLCDNSLSHIMKTRVVTNGCTKTTQVIIVTLRLHFMARINESAICLARIVCLAGLVVYPVGKLVCDKQL